VSGLQVRGPAVFWAAVRLARNGPGCMRPLAAVNAAAVVPGSLAIARAPE